ncbi:MAG: glutathione S-transferase N-terminal domain-containing protein [Oligoflexia bacterium]|nr:glutathione S-transferase N-terminal domain-containing protein [Oligoflexia bacterium]
MRNRLSQLGVDYIAHTVPKGNAFKHELLAQAGGKDQIPFLIDRKSGVKLYDSDKIISYLEHEFGRPAPARISELTRNVALRIQARSDELAWALRQPFERARSLVDDMSDSLKVLRDSYQSVRRALTQPAAAEERASTHKAA